MKLCLYSITYLGIWHEGGALSWKQVLQRAKQFGYDAVEFDAKRPHANPVDWDQRTREAVRNEAEKLGIALPVLAANNDFSSPVAEHRECQLLMVREQARLAADLGAKVLRLFGGWQGVTFRDGYAHFEEAVNGYGRAFPDVPYITRWQLARDCFKEAARFGEEFGVVMALQNHMPFLRTWEEVYDMVNEVDSPWLKLCWDLTPYERQPEQLAQFAELTGDLEMHCHYTGPFFRDDDGKIHRTRPLDYPGFLKLLKQIKYQGCVSFEFCDPAVDEEHNRRGLDFIDEQTALAAEYMRSVLASL